MLNNLLVVTSENSAKGYPKNIGIGEASIDALLGYLVVFLGIALLVGVVWLVGYVMRKASGKGFGKSAKKAEKKPEAPEPAQTAAAGESAEGVSDEEVAAIAAALMAYYAKEKPKCEFTVKRIRRI